MSVSVDRGASFLAEQDSEVVIRKQFAQTIRHAQQLAQEIEPRVILNDLSEFDPRIPTQTQLIKIPNPVDPNVFYKLANLTALTHYLALALHVGIKSLDEKFGQGSLTEVMLQILQQDLMLIKVDQSKSTFQPPNYYVMNGTGHLVDAGTNGVCEYGQVSFDDEGHLTLVAHRES